MTNEEKIEAFTMRINGATYKEIGERFNCSKQAVEQILKAVARTPKEREDYKDIKYPNIKQWIVDNEYTLTTLSDKLGITRQALTYNLKKITSFKIETINALLKLSGMKYEELFCEKEQSDE